MTRDCAHYFTRHGEVWPQVSEHMSSVCERFRIYAEEYPDMTWGEFLMICPNPSEFFALGPMVAMRPEEV